ncbi:sodium:solute symporter family protein [Bosea sp. SSUT16]|jgi:SSS family solute:Na+ symporter|uniref:Sodium:solute symporter family protein n=1 Tax=Bosea spartocytisi TaxID=2773451 RepID=A0A927E7H0_9HYPH|nr:sodium:solute symporter family protein [Bosea spartocytisi]MBD3845627.1 sodium:solute symporter family protein [Bosea spartocytisi]MCT4472920.1 sodium:solute symporter family protein [Bosea spartocytisi]
MIDHLNWPATAVFVFFFALVTVMGFVASRWKSGNLEELHEWGLGGRRFGAWITWFLLGGDLYTAYTVIAVPAVVYAIGAYGFFAVPYTILIYPFVFLTMPRLWNVAHKKGYITGSDFIYGRYGNKGLELAVAFTGILATMPYIALQLVGMEKVIQALGFQGEGMMSHLPLTIAFVILALYTYKSGLRAPAMIAFVKDIMIYVFVIAAVVIVPAKLGGYGAVFDAAAKAYEGKPNQGLILSPAQIAPFITLAIGSAMALFMYPHSMTGVLSASGPKALRRNAIALPAYSLVLALIALMGFMAHAAGIEVANPQDAVPQLFLKMFPSWFAGFSFAAIAIGALVPAAVMSIGAANTFTRNIWRPFVEPEMSPGREASLAKLMSLIVKVGALAVIVFMPTKFALDLQLLGGVWMIQIFPAIVFGLYTSWFSGEALLAGWVVGFGLGTYLSWGPTAWVPTSLVLGYGAYNGIVAVVANTVVAAVLSLVLRRARGKIITGDFADAPRSA